MVKVRQGVSTKRFFSLATASITGGVLIAALAISPAHADEYASFGARNCGTKTVVSVSQTTIDAFHRNVRNGVVRSATFQGLLIFPEVRRAYPNWVNTTSSNLRTTGGIYSWNSECA